MAQKLGRVGEEELETLEALCQAAELEVAGRLREGLVPEECGLILGAPKRPCSNVTPSFLSFHTISYPSNAIKSCRLRTRTVPFSKSTASNFTYW